MVPVAQMTLVNAGLNSNLMVSLGSLFLGITCSIGLHLIYFFIFSVDLYMGQRENTCHMLSIFLLANLNHKPRRGMNMVY